MAIFWIAFVVLVLVDLLISAVRISVLNAHLPTLLSMSDQNIQAVERVMALVGKPRLRTSLRLGVLMVHAMLIGVTSWLFITLLGTVPAFGAALLLLIVFALLLMIVEYLIEGVILPNAEVWALRLSGLAQAIDVVLSPLSGPLTLLLGSEDMLGKRLSPVTEEELKSWAEEERPEGTLEQDERQMIYSIFHFGDTMVREIMVPRIDILALDANTSLNEAIQALNTSGHSRVPVYEETIDNVIGLLYAKDLLGVPMEGQKLASLRSLLRPAYFVPEAKKVDELLREMQARSVHMALVVDEYGGIAGLVTLEDIVEEIVGEIRDEYDQSEELLFEKVSDDEYIFHGRIDLDDFNTVMGAHLPKDGTDTLGGFIYSQLGRIPVEGETIEVDGVVLTIEQVSGRRIRRVRALRRSTIPETEEKTNGNATEE